MKGLKNKKNILIGIGIMVLLIGLIVGFKNRRIHYSESSIIETDIIKEDSTGESVDANIIGYLSIDSISLIDAPIAEGTDAAVLSKYIGHFEETPIKNGNVGLAAHNRGYENNYFENLKNVKVGDMVTYKTKNSSEDFSVIHIQKVKETNVRVLKDNFKDELTLITCVENEPAYRLCIVCERR